MAMVKQDLAKGMTKDRGNFVGEGTGIDRIEIIMEKFSCHT